MSCRWKVDRTLVLEPFASDVTALLDGDVGEWVVTYGFRTRAEQEALYEKYQAGGPLAAPPGKSAHEFGLAVDVTLVQNGADDWDYDGPDWQRLIAAVRAAPRLHSGADFPTPDQDHIEATHWHTLVAPA